jgi:hypothetical protein
VCSYTKRLASLLSGGLDARWPGSYLRLRRRRFLLRLLRAIEISQLAGHLSLLRERADNTTYTNFSCTLQPSAIRAQSVRGPNRAGQNSAMIPSAEKRFAFPSPETKPTCPPRVSIASKTSKTFGLSQASGLRNGARGTSGSSRAWSIRVGSLIFANKGRALATRYSARPGYSAPPSGLSPTSRASTRSQSSTSLVRLGSSRGPPTSSVLRC